MKRLITAILIILPNIALGQSDFYKNVLRRATFYGAVNGGNSVSEREVFLSLNTI